MHKAVNSLVLLPTLLEQVFERFSSSGSNDRADTENLLLDLHKLLGRRIVPAALQILDYQTIVIYTNNPKTVEVAEICDVHSFRVARLLLHINYCTCKYFKEKVLVKETSSTAPYTCQHVLSVRLAIALQHKCLKFEEVSTYNLDLLLATFIETSSETE